jgi:hypothetical protein
VKVVYVFVTEAILLKMAAREGRLLVSSRQQL